MSPAYIEALPQGRHQLVVLGSDGQSRPFFCLPSELNNSSFSDPSYISTVFPRLTEQGFNTLLCGVGWEQIEPTEGDFSFARLDACIQRAREEGLRLVLLWFGAFKNGQSQYAPPWVKRNPSRFPRVMAKVKESSAAAMFPTASLAKPSLLPLEILSVFHDTTSAAESRAFSRLMRHLRETDEEHGTVITVQVENEVGVLEDSRDRSRAAQEAFDSEVPEPLARYLTDELKTLHPALRGNLETFERNVKEGPSNPSWSQLFGESDQTDEIFMAYHYARYVETIAAAGKKEYNLPMFTNAWLRSDQTEIKDDNEGGTASAALVTNGTKPGEYPSGGPIETVLDIWQLVAKSLDFFSPDCYFQSYEKTCANFSHRSQPLFIPEQRADGVGAIRIWEAIGTFGALGASPFGIDSVPDELNGFPPHLELLNRVGPIILRARQMGQSMRGFYFEEYKKDSPDPSPAKRFRMGDWNVLVERAFVCGHPAAGYGMIIQIEHDRFLLIGAGFQVKITPSDPDALIFGIASCQEKQVVDSDTVSDTDFTLETLRWLNGDETRQGGYTVMPTEHPDYGDVPIAMSIPARTKIAECQPYVVKEKARE